MTLQIGLLVFDNITQLDMTGPYEVFIKYPDASVHLISHSLNPITAAGGMKIIPGTTYANCPQLDIVCVPGGAGMNRLLNDTETHDFLRKQAPRAQYVTSVCTGSLVLGAAGLLNGRRATTHWMSHELLSQFGAIPVNERIVIDGKVVTGGGVTAGIDFALTLAATMFDDELAKKIQLGIEYNPAPPFTSGSPETADAVTVESMRKASEPRQQERLELVQKAAENQRRLK